MKVVNENSLDQIRRFCRIHTKDAAGYLFMLDWMKARGYVWEGGNQIEEKKDCRLLNHYVEKGLVIYLQRGKQFSLHLLPAAAFHDPEKLEKEADYTLELSPRVDKEYKNKVFPYMNY